MQYHVVIPAAGTGERFSEDIPKQFCWINGWPVICHTVEKFVRDSCVKNIVVVAPTCEKMTAKMVSLFEVFGAENARIFITSGAGTRHRSIQQGLKRLRQIIETTSDWEKEIVIIHDGVRPFINKEDINRVACETAKYQAAGIVKPLVSTVISTGNDDMLQDSLDRSKHYSSEMPQGFELGLILDAFSKCTDYELDHGTECLQLAMKYGSVRPKLIHGQPDRLWKVTYKQDIHAARAVLKSHMRILFIVRDDVAVCDHAKLCAGDAVINWCKSHQLSQCMRKTTCGVIYFVPDTSKMQSCVEEILAVSSSTQQCSKDLPECVVVFLVNASPEFIFSGKERVTFQDAATEAKKHGLLFIIVVASVDDLFESAALKNARLMVENPNRMLQGQILYYTS